MAVRLLDCQVMLSGLRARIVLIAAVAVLPAMAVITYAQRAARDQEREKTIEDNLGLARLAASEEAGVLVGAQRLMLTLSHVPDIPDSLEQCALIFRRIMDDHPGFMNVGVIDPSGSVVCSSEAVTGGRVDDREWFQQAVRTRTTTVSGPQISRTSGVPDIVVAQPILNKDGAVRYVMAVGIDVKRFAQIAAAIPPTNGTTVTLFDRTRTIVTRSPGGDTWVGRRVEAPSIVEWMRSGRGDELITEDVGVDQVRRRYVTVRANPGFDTGLYLGLGIDETTMFAEAEARYRRQLALLILIAVVAIAAAIVLGHTFVLMPVNSLRTMTARLAAGDFAARVRLPATVRELNDLGHDVDFLASALEARKRERDAAERELRASEDRYRLLFAQNPHPMWVFDRETLAFLEVNDAAVEKYGYSREAFLAMRITDIRPEEDVPRLTDSLIRDRDVWNQTDGWRHRLKNGDLIDVEIAAHRLTFDGRAAELVTAQDVTDRLRAEAALSERTALTALMADIGVAFSRPRPLGPCLQSCTEALVAYIGATCARVWTVDEADGRLRLQGRAGDCTSTTGAAIAEVDAAETRIAERVASERQPLSTSDVAAQFGAADTEFGYAARPLIAERRVVGVMTVLMNRPLSETAATALGAVADHLALGVARHRAEEARRLLASIVASSEDAILATTLDGTIVSWNGGAERLYGYAAQEALGRRISMTYPPDRIDEFYDFVGQLQTGGSVVHRETVRRRKDGVEVTVALTVSPIKDGTGALIGKSVIVRDITERKRAEQTLRESQERFRLIAETVTQVFWIADADIQAITYISPAYECIWGRSCESLYENPRSFLDAVHDDDREAVMRTLGAQQRGEPFDHEYRIIRPDGETRWIWDRGFPVAAAAGRSTQYVGVAADITESRSIEDQLRQAQKMEAIGQLAGGIAHDFNNLLTAILGFSGFLADSLPEDDDRRRDVDEIRHAGERAATLTRQLLAFGRKQILDVRVLHIGDVVGELTPMLRRLVSEAIDLRTTTGDRGVIKADPGQLQQVLMNLVVNARDAMPDGGRLTIETSDVVLDDAFVRRHPGAQPGAHVALSVRDTGIGMDAATLKRIFEPFFTTKPKGQGTGLGLATVYGIVKQSGGAIWVESEVGKGTAFTVCLPRTDEVQAADGAATTQAPARRGDETVLLVEDEDVVREFVYKVLTRKGYTVHALPDPQRAIEYAEAHRAPIDLVFTDVVLPEMNGKAMVTRLRAQHPEAKVLYMSGYDDNAIVSHGVLDIDTELLPKPFTADALMRKVRDVLDA